MPSVSPARFFDAHCDTIGKVVEKGADFAAGEDLHITLAGLMRAGVCAQVFAAWAWTGHYRGREYEAAMQMLAATQTLCDAHPEQLFRARTGGEIAEACRGGARIAVIPGLEGADPLMGDVGNLGVFHRAGVRLVTLAWGDNAFSGTVFGDGSGLTSKGSDLVAACEDLGILVDVSHISDLAFDQVCAVAKKPFVASHSNCRSLCPNDRNLSDDMIRSLAERGGALGINLGSAFLSAAFYEQTRATRDEVFRSVRSGEKTFEEAGEMSSAANARIPRPPLGLVVDHVKHALRVGGEECVGLGGDLDGVDSLPEGLDGVADYPRLAELLAAGGLSPAQVDKVCWGNFARVFREVVT